MSAIVKCLAENSGYYTVQFHSVMITWFLH